MEIKIRRMVYTIIIGLALGYLLLVGFVYIRQGSMVYYPTKDIEATPADIGLKYEEITLTTKDSVNLSAWYVPARDERGVVLFCHGNAGNISHRLDSIRIFHDLGLSVLIFDYRGYGKSEGSPTEEGTYLDAESAWEYLVNVKKCALKRLYCSDALWEAQLQQTLRLGTQQQALSLNQGLNLSLLSEQSFSRIFP